MRFLADESCESPDLRRLRPEGLDFLKASGGIAATELQTLMGHEDLSTTQRYVRVAGRDLERAMARLKAWRDTRGGVSQDMGNVLRPAST